MKFGLNWIRRAILKVAEWIKIISPPSKGV